MYKYLCKMALIAASFSAMLCASTASLIAVDVPPNHYGPPRAPTHQVQHPAAARRALNNTAGAHGAVTPTLPTNPSSANTPSTPNTVNIPPAAGK